MKFLAAAIAIVIFAPMAGIASAQQPTDYRTAYNQTQQGTKPLLVLVTAEWCPPCQVMKKTYEAVAPIPGRIRGSTIRQNACQRVQPSISAASSRSLGIEAKNPRKSQTPTGTEKVR